MTEEAKKFLINAAESCIKTLEDYINGENCVAITSIISDDKPVYYWDVKQIDTYFNDHCESLETISYKTENLRTRYKELRKKCEEIYKLRGE